MLLACDTGKTVARGSSQRRKFQGITDSEFGEVGFRLGIVNDLSTVVVDNVVGRDS